MKIVGPVKVQGSLIVAGNISGQKKDDADLEMWLTLKMDWEPGEVGM